VKAQKRQAILPGVFVLSPDFGYTRSVERFKFAATSENMGWCIQELQHHKASLTQA